MSRRTLCAVLLVSTLGGGASEALGQEWSVDLSAGQTTFDPVSANVGTHNLVGSLRYDARTGAWVYGAAAAPLGSEDPYWGALGTGGRFVLAGSDARSASAGLELGVHGFLFRDPVVGQRGTGGTIEAMPFASVGGEMARVELRGGWRGHTLSYAGATGHRHLLEAGARVVYGRTLSVHGEARWVRASEGAYPFLGAAVVYGGSPLHVWVQAGRWMDDTLDDVTWGAGAGLAMSRRMTLWTRVRQEAPDPLYWNVARRSWSVGVTTRFGRAPLAALAPPRVEAGRVVIRVPVAEASMSELWIAGSFNEWRPVRMQREDRHWVIQMRVAPGVHYYAFRSESGGWFVPASVPGRREDGMGGHVAILVVS
jgi:hypothetical protein